MGTWDCIDGGLNERWTYVSMGMVRDIRQVLRGLDAAWPSPATDTTAWSSAIGAARNVRAAHLQVVRTLAPDEKSSVMTPMTQNSLPLRSSITQ